MNYMHCVMWKQPFSGVLQSALIWISTNYNFQKIWCNFKSWGKKNRSFYNYDKIAKFIRIFGILTLNTSFPTYSFTANMTVSMMPIRTSWMGEAFPRIAPKEIRMVAAVMSAVTILEKSSIVCNAVFWQMSSYRFFNIRCHTDSNFPLRIQPKEPRTQNPPLYYNSSDEKREADGAESIFAEKCHQKSKPDEYHHMDILEH